MKKLSVELWGEPDRQDRPRVIVRVGARAILDGKLRLEASPRDCWVDADEEVDVQLLLASNGDANGLYKSIERLAAEFAQAAGRCSARAHDATK